MTAPRTRRRAFAFVLAPDAIAALDELRDALGLTNTEIVNKALRAIPHYISRATDWPEQPLD